MFSDSYYYFTSNLIIFIREEVKTKILPQKGKIRNLTAKKGGQRY